jgi:hypothetical protein
MKFKSVDAGDTHKRDEYNQVGYRFACPTSKQHSRRTRSLGGHQIRPKKLENKNPTQMRPNGFTNDGLICISGLK